MSKVAGANLCHVTGAERDQLPFTAGQRDVDRARDVVGQVVLKKCRSEAERCPRSLDRDLDEVEVRDLGVGGPGRSHG